MVGVQKMVFTEGSVTEALADYLNKHLALGCVVQVTSWGEENGQIECHFEQVVDNLPKSTP